MKAEINGVEYRIEWSYRRRPNHARHPRINGIAACAIVSDKVIATGAAVCGAEDAWSRRKGRMEAFYQAVASCGVTAKDEGAFAQWFDRRFPAPAKKPAKKKYRITIEQRNRYIQAGEAVRLMRLRRNAGTMTGQNG